MSLSVPLPYNLEAEALFSDLLHFLSYLLSLLGEILSIVQLLERKTIAEDFTFLKANAKKNINACKVPVIFTVVSNKYMWTVTVETVSLVCLEGKVSSK